MTFEEYIKECLVTESVDPELIKQRLLAPERYRLLHGGMGVSTEANEILDMLKKHFFYGKALDLVNLEEEIGDLFWYVSIMIDAMRQMGHVVDLDTILDKKIKKLQKRYEGKFTETKAIGRDLEAERKILEGENS